MGDNRPFIQDLSPLGHQPTVSDDCEFVLVFYGETYNFKHFREELSGKGCQFKGNSDTEVLLNVYLAEGEKMLDR